MGYSRGQIRRQSATGLWKPMRLVHLVAIVALALAPSVLARGGSHSSASNASSHEARTYSGVTRDVHGKIARSPHAKEAFRHSHPCPATGKT